MKKIYPAIFHVEETGGYWIEFPDIPGAFTQGDDLNHGIDMAREVMEVMLATTYLEQGEELPIPTPVHQVKTEFPSDIVTLIQGNPYPYVRDNKTVRKNVTVPEWLVKLADKAGVNYSETLTKALEEKLGVN